MIIVLLGWFASKYVYVFLIRIFEKNHFDTTLARFLANVAKVVVLAAMIVVALGKIGISIAPFVAAIGAISFDNWIGVARECFKLCSRRFTDY